MKTQVKKVDATKKEITIEVTGDAVKNKFEEVFQKIAKDAKVPGFRPGHVPRDILEKNFSGQAHEMVMQELIPEVYHQAIGTEKLEVIDLPDISDVKLDRLTLSFKATVEISPEIALPSYKGMAVDYVKPEVSGDEVKRSIDSLKESRKAEAVDERFARSLGYPDVAELEKSVERQLAVQKEQAGRQKTERHLLETLLKDMTFKLPLSLVNRQLQDILRQAKLDLALKGMPRPEIDAKEAELAKQFQSEAERQVRTYLVLSEIAKKESIPLDDHMPQKVIELLLREAHWK